MDGSLFSYDLAIYITTINQRVVARALQGVSNKLGSGEGLTFSPNKTVSMIFRKRRKSNEEPMEIMLRTENMPSKERTQFYG